MKNYIKRFALLLMATVMVACMFSGCGDKKDDDKVSGGKDGVSTSTNVNPEDYRGSTVTYVTWKDPDNNEDGTVIKAFEEKYGIKVDISLVAEADYINTIASSIASGTQGDVLFVNGTFPGALSVMQPLDAAKLNLNDSIWKQSTIKASTIDGRPFLVDTVSNVWGEVDILIYNKALFEQNGITSPAEYYEAGNWTLATFKKACQDIVALGKGYTGATVLGESFMGACGASTFTYENGEFKTSLNERYYDAFTALSEMFTDGLIGTMRTGFTDGKTGMAITNCFGLKRTGYFSTINSDYVAATYLPRFDENSEQVTTGLYRGWGLIRGAKNPEAAGLFLSEYLNVNNYDLEATFHNQDVANFFFKVTSDENDIQYYYTYGLGFATGETDMVHFENTAYQRTPDQMKSFLDSQLPTFEYMASKGNSILSTERKWFNENFPKK